MAAELDEWLIPAGFQAAGIKAGIKASGSLDLAVITSELSCSAAGTFTTNRIAAAPVKWCRGIVPANNVRAIVINAGNANAATGEQGYANAIKTAELAARRLACNPDQILLASTGVIGHQLPMEKIEAGVEAALDQQSADPVAFDAASRAILTTDTRPKVFQKQVELDDERAFRLLGIAKGAAMIGPRMATMLAFLLTDAHVTPGILQGILSEAVETSFNCVSVEGHTSTNDTVLLLAGGRGTMPLKGRDLKVFRDVVEEACQDLARKIADDGEGATHLITIDIEGALDREQARTLARAVADSPLVKTAIHGADPNWGRIVSAAGYCGVPFDESEVSLWLNGTPLYQNGAPLPFDAPAVSASIRANRETHIRLTFQHGQESLRFWSSDLTAEYVRLNADYTT
jgi:glutamate N-acetyltransferase/amino-acid N-acetyltransferase